jgi:hypothetical protein
LHAEKNISLPYRVYIEDTTPDGKSLSIRNFISETVNIYAVIITNFAMRRLPVIGRLLPPRKISLCAAPSFMVSAVVHRLELR